MSWPDPVERVAAFLRAAGAEARLEEFESATPSARSAADAIGCSLEQIVKSLLFMCEKKPVLALLPGDRRADPARIALVAEASAARVARPAEVVEVTGFAPGGVSPVPPPPDTLVLIERTIISFPVVWVGGGSDRHMAMLSPHELVRLSGGSLVDIAQG